MEATLEPRRRSRSLRPRLFTSRLYLSAFAAVQAAVGGNSSGAAADVNPHEGRTKAEVTDRVKRKEQTAFNRSTQTLPCGERAGARGLRPGSR